MMRQYWKTSMRALTALLVSGAALNVAHAAETYPQDLVDQGRYLATASDCIACHTAPRGKPMAGGLNIASPVGTIVSSNITPSKTAGIGDYTEAQFADALRKGVRADGANLYPAMPYTAYAVFTDADVHALYAYFMQGVTPVDTRPAPTELPFPMNIRMSMKFWNLMFLNDKPMVSDPHQSEEWNRGRYLVDGAAHCSTCHTPRGVMMQEIPALAMSGAQVGAWYAPNITPDPVSGIGAWTQAELVTYLKTGRLPGKAQAAGSMAEAITHSFQYLSDTDVNAIAVYMHSLPATHTDNTVNRFDGGKASNDLNAFRGTPYDAQLTGVARGAQVYTANCASCHGVNAQGSADGYYPSLFHNSATNGANPNNLLAAILYGVDRQTAAGGHVFMPPFGHQANAPTQLSNDDVANLANYLLGHYGNSAQTVKAADVETIRRGGPQSNLLTLARIGMGVGALVVLLLIAVWLRRRNKNATR